MKTAHQTFIAIWNSLPAVEFKGEWHNGTGYMNGARQEKIESPVRFTDNWDRKGLLIPTNDGSLVVFERYSDGDQGVIVSNSRPELFTTSLCPLAMELVYDKVNRKLTEEAVQAYIDATYIKEFTNDIMQRFKEAGWVA